MNYGKLMAKELLNNVSILCIYFIIHILSNMKSDSIIAEAFLFHKFKQNINAQSEICHGTLSLF